MKLAVLIATFALLIAGAGFVRSHIPELRAIYHTLPVYARLASIERNVRIKAQDGVHLASDVYLPRQASSKPVGTILVRLPYDKTTYGGGLLWSEHFVPRGYAVVIQDMRGRFASEGTFEPYSHAKPDGAATLDWIAAQPWSNGKIATAGCSALAESQAMLAAVSHPRHTAMIAEGGGGAIGTGGPSRSYFAFFEGGIPKLASSVGWFAGHGGKTPDAMGGPSVTPEMLRELPSGTIVSRHRSTPTDYEPFTANFEDDAYWQRLGYLTGKERFTTPALHVNTWHDVIVQGTFEVADVMRRSGADQHVVIGPGIHCDTYRPFNKGHVGDLKVDPAATFDYWRLYDDWLAALLNHAPRPKLPNYIFYVLGADRWQTAAQWPPKGTTTQEWYLSRGGGLQRTASKEEATRRYDYDPVNPTPSIGGPICCISQPGLRIGPIDQRPNEGRADLLSFHSAPLKTALTIIGDVRLRLRFSSSAKDTDLIAILLDEHADGRLIPIQHTALRLRYRHGFDDPHLLTPDKAETFTITFPQIAFQLMRGHKLALHITSSSFPRLERNMNMGTANHLETRSVIAHNTLHLGGDDATRLILPIAPENGGEAPPKCPKTIAAYCS